MIDIINSKSVFALYLGLIHSGYNLSDKISLQFIKDEIMSMDFDSTIIDYFKMARDESCEVNPYWPFGFVLTYIVLYMDEMKYEGLNEHQVNKLVNKLSQVNTGLITKPVIEWCAQLKSIIDEIIMSKGFDTVWSNYLDFSLSLRKTISEFESQFIDKIKNDPSINIVVILNELQASQLTDYAKFGEKVFIITSSINERDIIHEYLHYYFDEILLNTKKEICEHQHLLDYIYDDMVRYQYAWAKDGESWLRVFEENLMRAATISFSSEKEENKLKNINTYFDEGFIYCKPIYELIKVYDISYVVTKECIHNCLIACNEFVENKF